MTAVAVAALTLLGAGCIGPPVPAPTGGGTTIIPCSAADQDHDLVANADLDPSCTYTGHFRILQGGVRLDCNGARITGTDGTGIEVSTPSDVSMEGVRIQECRTDGFLNGIRVTRTGFRALAPGHEYDNKLSDVLIDDTQVSNSRGVGIYVDGYVSRVTIRGAVVTNAGSSGIYLEAGSRGNTVIGSTIRDSGYRENGPDGQLFSLGGTQFRYWGPGREGMSIDGSSDNLILGNTFSGNAAGGVYLYTNCGEYVHTRPERYFQRRTQATRNLIQGNRFTGGLNGVWVGSRMSDNTYPMDCSNPAYRSAPFESVTLDFAPANTIRANSFTDVVHGVRVEDDDTQVIANTFRGPDPSYHAIVVGTKWRTSDLARPVTGTVISGNSSTIAGNASPYRWIYGLGTAQVTGNTALGRATGICQAPPIPISVFVMVYAVALEPVGSPPTPRPDITIPRLPALPSCTFA
jgi:parallel beta-helix repeat protein